jgi:hypothetical protein
MQERCLSCAGDAVEIMHHEARLLGVREVLRNGIKHMTALTEQEGAP